MRNSCACDTHVLDACILLFDGVRTSNILPTTLHHEAGIMNCPKAL